MTNEKNIVLGPWLEPSSIGAPLQLDLFDNSLPIKNRYTFLDVDSQSQNSLLKILDSFSVDLVVDIRHFPVFSRPKFYHRELLATFSDNQISYVPIVFETKHDTSLSKFRHWRTHFTETIEHGSIVFLFGKERHTSRVLREWKSWMNRNFESAHEFNSSVTLSS